MDWPKLIAHRGASLLAPENTLVAFKLAKTHNIHWIECDVTLTKDGIPIIFHDKTLKRQVGINKKINHMRYADINEIDIGAWFSLAFKHEKIPTLKALLIWAKANAVFINLEVKANNYRLKFLLKEIKKILSETEFSQGALLISSFELKALKYAHAILPQVKRGLLMSRWKRRWRSVCKKLEISSVHCHHKLATVKHIKNIKSHGYKIYCYTVNDKKLAIKLFRKGIDGIFSDDPFILSEQSR